MNEEPQYIDAGADGLPDPNALASALPAGVTANDGRWHAAEIAQFQADRLAETGYRLVHTDASPQTFAEHTAQAIWLLSGATGKETTL